MLTKSGRCPGLIAVYFVVMALSRGSVYAAASPASLSSVSSALEQLASPDFAERRKAMKSADSYLAAQDAAWLDTADDEVKLQVATVFQFNRQLTPWLLELLKLPEPKKQEQIKLLTGPELAPFLGMLFSEESDQRVQGVKKLVQIQAPGTDLLLSHFLSDGSPPVALAAMEVVWDRPATEETVLPLWEIGVGDSLKSLSPAPPTTPPAALTFRGLPLEAPRAPRWGPVPLADGQARLKAIAARAVLGHLRAPELEPLLIKALNELADKLNGPDDLADIFQLPLRKQAIFDAVTALASIGEKCQWKSTIPGFFALGTVPVNADREMGYSLNGPAAAYYSIRTSALAAALQLTNQDPRTYGMLEVKQRLPSWAAPDKGGEEHAVDKLKSWWKDNSAHYTAGSPQ